jgi:hypothetical protein
MTPEEERLLLLELEEDGMYRPAECIVCHEDTRLRSGGYHQAV